MLFFRFRSGDREAGRSRRVTRPPVERPPARCSNSNTIFITGAHVVTVSLTDTDAIVNRHRVRGTQRSLSRAQRAAVQVHRRKRLRSRDLLGH
jgi:hypothetical protein